MELSDQVRGLPSPTIEAIDFGKLKTIIRTNWFWIAVIFLVVNSVAYLIVRYSKNVYQSSSEVKLDIKSEASELGIKTFVENENVNLISGEMEIIQSKLFLSEVVKATDFEISFISVGRLLNDELYGRPPAFITVHNTKHSYYDVPIHFRELDEQQFTLKVGEAGDEVNGTYGKPMLLDNLQLTLSRNNAFTKGDEVAYYFILNSPDALIDYIGRNLTVEPLNLNANIIGISFKDFNPFKARDVLNKIDSIYLSFSNEQKNQTNKQKIDWLTNELSRIEARMEDYETYFKEFTLENKTNNLNDNLQHIIEGINTIDSQRFDLSRRIRESETIDENLRQNNFQVVSTLRGVLPPAFAKNIDDLQQLSLEQEKMRLSYQESAFAYREKQMQVDILRNKCLQQLEQLKKEWVRRLEELNTRKEQLEAEFRGYPDKNTEFIKNQRFYKLYEEFYLSLMQSKSGFEIAQAGTTANFQILSPASYPGAPISPNKPLIYGVGLVLSLVINFFFIGVLYLLNNKITSLSELERVKGAPVIGVIPSSKYSTPGLHILDYPKSMMSEAIRTIRTNLDFFHVSAAQKVVAISSTISGEGKSFIAMNLGGILALSKKRVLLIDLDMRKSKPSLPTDNIDNTRGMSTILIRKHQWSDCVVKTAIETFDFIPSGPHPPNPSELLLNAEFGELIDNLKKEYDYIILDTPPVGLVTDGIMAMRKADICIYIFRANYSKKEFIYNLQRIVNINKFTNITTLLNAVPRGGKPYGYGYYEEPKKPSKLKTAQHV